MVLLEPPTPKLLKLINKIKSLPLEQGLSRGYFFNSLVYVKDLVKVNSHSGFINLIAISSFLILSLILFKSCGKSRNKFASWISPRSINREDFIFKTCTGKHLSESTLRKAWNKSIKELSLPHIDLYSGLKRSSGQLLVNNGTPIEQVRVLMGQLSVDSTKHYVSESATSLRGLVEELQKKLRVKLKSEEDKIVLKH